MSMRIAKHDSRNHLHHPVPKALKSRLGGLILLDLLGLFVLVDLPATSVEIHFGKADKLGLVPELPAEPHDEVHGDTNVGGDEGAGVPLAVEEDGEACEKKHETKEEETEVGKVGLEWRDVWQGAPGDLVKFETVVKASIRSKNREPR